MIQQRSHIIVQALGVSELNAENQLHQSKPVLTGKRSHQSPIQQCYQIRVFWITCHMIDIPGMRVSMEDSSGLDEKMTSPS